MGNLQQANIDGNLQGASLTGIVSIGRQCTPQGTAVAVKGRWAGRRGNYDVVLDNPEVWDSLNVNDYIEVPHTVVISTSPRITLRGEIQRLCPYGVKQP